MSLIIDRFQVKLVNTYPSTSVWVTKLIYFT